ncbi:MAG: hypothetical protein BWY49_00059 [Candidatus Omnitrophica bacterium ADurb.Bin314]|nr:MAG: hypothetical protein BWY49_00059 [Candidatus Omnitrophica bacterium ADurb.Bin314]
MIFIRYRESGRPGPVRKQRERLRHTVIGLLIRGFPAVRFIPADRRDRIITASVIESVLKALPLPDRQALQKRLHKGPAGIILRRHRRLDRILGIGAGIIGKIRPVTAERVIVVPVTVAPGPGRGVPRNAQADPFQGRTGVRQRRVISRQLVGFRERTFLDVFKSGRGILGQKEFIAYPVLRRKRHVPAFGAVSKINFLLIQIIGSGPVRRLPRIAHVRSCHYHRKSVRINRPESNEKLFLFGGAQP